jgi:NAD(P)-dependent dehydrogenase (short-subunit alcohol dehydrogenase family)
MLMFMYSEGEKRMSKLEGKVAIVTGGGKGIGLGIATAYIKAGAAVVITGRTRETLEQTRAELLKLPGARVLALVADGTDPDAVKQVVSQTGNAFGQIDILVNNAQIIQAKKTPLEELTEEDFRDAYQSGVFAAWRYMVACLPYLKQTHGTIINFGSNAGIMGMTKLGAYGSNKEAIRGLTRTAAHEWAPFGITVNVLNPTMQTESSTFLQKQSPDYFQKFILGAIPLGDLGDPELHCGSLSVFLAAPEGKYMTGMTFDLDGGMSMRA